MIFKSWLFWLIWPFKCQIMIILTMAKFLGNLCKDSTLYLFDTTNIIFCLGSLFASKMPLVNFFWDARYEESGVWGRDDFEQACTSTSASTSTRLHRCKIKRIRLMRGNQNDDLMMEGQSGEDIWLFLSTRNSVEHMVQSWWIDNWITDDVAPYVLRDQAPT